MRLNEYIRSRGIKIKTFADKLGISTTALQNYMTGTIPRLDRAFQIEELTDGHVRAVLEDWAEPKRKNTKAKKGKEKD
jgi:transcriptional regulator with XRE-family HTH domain